MFRKLSLTLFTVCLISAKGYCYYDTCDCSNKSEQKFQYEDSFTMFNIYSPKTDLCISDTLKLNIRITNISEDTICIFKDLKLNYDKRGDYPNIFVKANERAFRAGCGPVL